MMRVMAADYAPLGIRVNMAIPGLHHTPMTMFAHPVICEALERPDPAETSRYR